MGNTVLSDLLVDLLDAGVDGLAVERTGNPEPDRVYISHGPPSVEVCEGDGLLVVYLDVARAVFARSQPANPPVAKTCNVAWQATLRLELWRCYPSSAPDGGPNTPEALTEASAALSRDGWCLLTEISRRHFAGDLFASVGCAEVTLQGLTILGPLGQAAGVATSVVVAISEGGPPAAAS